MDERLILRVGIAILTFSTTPKFVDPTGLQADDSQDFTYNPCEYGTAGCNPVQLATVTVTIPQQQPILLETDMSIIESVTLITTQVASDTVVGAGKSLYKYARRC